MERNSHFNVCSRGSTAQDMSSINAPRLAPSRALEPSLGKRGCRGLTALSAQQPIEALRRFGHGRRRLRLRAASRHGGTLGGRLIEQRIQICSLDVAQALGGRSPRIGLGPLVLCSACFAGLQPTGRGMF
jgi:hypothetical protein